jgi:hypothetical protein
MSNLHGIGLAIVMYQQDYKYAPIYFSCGEEYYDNTNIFVCPADPYGGMGPGIGAPPGDTRMRYTFYEDQWNHSVANSYWCFLTCMALRNGMNFAQLHAEELTGEAGYIPPPLDRDWKDGQEFCYLRCLDGHCEDDLYPTLTPSGRVVMYEPYLPNIWDCWPDWYRMEGY